MITINLKEKSKAFKRGEDLGRKVNNILEIPIRTTDKILNPLKTVREYVNKVSSTSNQNHDYLKGLLIQLGNGPMNKVVSSARDVYEKASGYLHR